jgi:hypothetical protein
MAFDFYSDWPDFSVKMADWLLSASHAAICANELHCTVANAATRILREMGFMDAQAWVNGVTDDTGNIIGYRLTVKVYMAEGWTLFYWALGERTAWVAGQTDKNGALPTWDIVETLKVACAPRAAEVRGEMTEDELEARQLVVKKANAKAAMKVRLGRLIVEKKISARGTAVTYEGNTYKVVDCLKAYEKSTAPKAKRKGALFGNRRRVNRKHAGKAFTGEASDAR